MDNRLQPSDLLVVLKLVAADSPSLPVRQLAQELAMPSSSVSKSLQRLRKAGLVVWRSGERDRSINRLALRAFLEHGARWIAPAQLGRLCSGLPTAHSAPPLLEKLIGDDDSVVIAFRGGAARGRAITPLHAHTPQACLRDPRLHRLVAVVDALRIGRTRDREVASQELRKWV